MEFVSVLSHIQRIVEKELADFFKIKREETITQGPQVAELVGQVEALTLRGGKRIRPFFCWLGYSIGLSNASRATPDFLADFPKDLMSAMLSLELFQSFALIHDDIMDEDTFRRGGPTVHAYFTARGSTFNSAHEKRFGESMALLAGDLALAWSDALMSEIENREVRSVYHTMKEEVIYGQTLDVAATSGWGTAPKATIDELKTALYTVVRPLQIGAAIGGAGEELHKALLTWGVPLGLLFQVRDDILDGTLSVMDAAPVKLRYQEQARNAVGLLGVSRPLVDLCEQILLFVSERKS